MTMSMILGVGSPVLDLLVMTDDAFLQSRVAGEKGGMVMVDAATQQHLIDAFPAAGVKKALGGSAFNTISALAHLGMPTAFLGKTGMDKNGQYILQAFAALGGDVSRFRTTPEFPAATCLSMVTPDSERTMRTHLGAASSLTAGEITDADFTGITHVHVEGYFLFLPGVVEKVMALAKKHECTVSLDLASFEIVRIFKPQLRDLLRKYVDIVFANEDEAREFCEPAAFSAESAVRVLRQYCRTAVIKLGSKGAYLENDHETVMVPSLSVKAVDTTGAGDLWQAGFLYGYLNGLNLQKAGEMGNILGSEIVQVLGAELPVNRWNDVQTKFNQIKERKND